MAPPRLPTAAFTFMHHQSAHFCGETHFFLDAAPQIIDVEGRRGGGGKGRSHLTFPPLCHLQPKTQVMAQCWLGCMLPPRSRQLLAALQSGRPAVMQRRKLRHLLA
eukprot:scaffold2651_cov12-Tisochrysis_lutea.AAC.1